MSTCIGHDIKLQQFPNFNNVIGHTYDLNYIILDIYRIQLAIMYLGYTIPHNTLRALVTLVVVGRGH